MTSDFHEADVQRRIVRGEEVYRMVGLSQSTVYRLRQQGKFPPPMRLGGNSIGWLEQDIIDWIGSRPRVGS